MELLKKGVPENDPIEHLHLSISQKKKINLI